MYQCHIDRFLTPGFRKVIPVCSPVLDNVPEGTGETVFQDFFFLLQLSCMNNSEIFTLVLNVTLPYRSVDTNGRGLLKCIHPSSNHLTSRTQGRRTPRTGCQSIVGHTVQKDSNHSDETRIIRRLHTFSAQAPIQIVWTNSATMLLILKYQEGLNSS